MNMLGRFRKLDSSLQRGIDNGFARVFGGAVVPAEIEELLKQEAEDSLVYGPQGTLYAPDHFVAYIATKDAEELEANQPDLSFDLSDRLGRFIRNEGWLVRQRVEVTLKGDKDLHSGQMKCHSSVSEDESIYSDNTHPATGSYHASDYKAATQGGNQGGQQVGFESDQQSHGDADQPSAASAHSQYPHTVDYQSFRQAQAWSEVAEAAETANPAAEMGQAPPLASAGLGEAAAEHNTKHTYGGQGGYSGGESDQSHNQNYSEYDSYNPYTADHGTGSGQGSNSQPTEPAVTLLLQDGSSRTYHVHEGSNIIGRGNQVDFRLPDTGVSRKHAELVWDGEEAVLVDLQSTNGTTVNDTPIENWLLADGDVITLGHSYIEVRINQPQGNVGGSHPV